MYKLKHCAPWLLIAACVALSWPLVSVMVRVLAAVVRLVLPGMSV
jgi:hypothetical protein